MDAFPPSTTPQPSFAGSSLSTRRIMLLKRILTVCLWISVALLVGLVVITVLLNFPNQLLATFVGFGLITAGFAWTRQQINGRYFEQSITVLVAALLITAIIITIIFHNGLSPVLGGVIISLLILSLAGMSRTIPWMIGIGITLIIPLGLLEQFGLIESWHLESGTVTNLVIPILTGVDVIVAGMFIYLLNQNLQQSLRESEERGASTEAARAEQALTLQHVQSQAAEQARLLELVRDLETPVIPLFEGVLALPIVGHLDPVRLNNLSHMLFERIAAERAHTVLIDVTAVSMIDTASANYLLQLVQGVRLLGAECMLTGIRADVAQMLVSLGVKWESISTAASLRDGIARLQKMAQPH